GPAPLTHVPACSASTGSALRPDELVERSDGLSAGDRDVASIVLPPGDAQLVERVGEDSADVVGGIGEEVARVGVTLRRPADVSLGPVGDAAPVAVDQPPDQRPRILVDELLLP